MENASKALLIAGGILLAIILLSLFVYMITSVNTIAEAQDIKTLNKQVDNFNKLYTAYDKKRMYGTDVITVINKAIDHNSRINVGETDPYYVNIIIKTTENFRTTIDKVDNTKAENNKSTLSDEEAKATLLKEGINIGREIKTILKTGSHELGYWRNGTLEMDKDIINFFNNDKTDEIITTTDKKTTYYIYSALTNFKRAIFECEEVKYNESTGRIESMTFIQI